MTSSLLVVTVKLYHQNMYYILATSLPSLHVQRDVINCCVSTLVLKGFVRFVSS